VPDDPLIYPKTYMFKFMRPTPWLYSCYKYETTSARREEATLQYITG